MTKIPKKSFLIIHFIPGRFSVGGGFVVSQFTDYDSLPPQFDRTGSWELLGNVARSGNGDTGAWCVWNVCDLCVLSDVCDV